MSRYEDIQAHLWIADKSLERIESSYQISLKDREILPQLKIEIKNYLENLRSVLDYLANEINERYCSKKTKVYFPTSCYNHNAFASYMRRYFPGLQVAKKDIYDKFESFQSYVPKAPKCLPLFASLVNENKHDRLSPQTRTEKRGLKIDFSGGGGITLGPGARITGTGSIISGGHVLDFGGKTISGDSPAEYVPETIKQTVIIWVGFRFDAIDREALPFLKEIISVVRNITRDLSQDLWP